MTVYAVAQLTIHDRAAYGRYQAGFMDVLKRFGGRLLAADETPVVCEGEWDRDKIVILSFAEEAAFRAWLESDAYQAIAKDRKAGARTIILMAHGLGD